MPNKELKMGRRILVILFIALILASCGEESNSPPVAVAGTDQNQPRGATILLDGSNSSDPDGDNLTYAWTLTAVPLGSAAILSDSTSKTPNFVADLIGEYVIGLVVSDGRVTSVADEVKVVVNTALIYENDFSQNTLGDFIVGEVGTAKVSIEQGQLKIAPGEGYLNRGYVSLNLPALSQEYPAKLIENTSRVIWAFNVSNVDGPICGVCNNKFQFNLYSDPDPSAPTAFGYGLIGGGLVGSRVLLTQDAHASSPFGPMLTMIVDLPNGPETLPIIGAFRIVYEPITSRWEVYYEESTTKLNPMAISTLVGSGINTGFVTQQLPYLILGSENPSSAYFDNLTVMLKF